MTQTSNSLERLDRRIVQVSGADAANFLQGLISNDIARATRSTLAYAFLLSPQGKYLYDFFVAEIDDGYWLDVGARDAAALAAKLNQYKLRAKISISVSDTISVYSALKQKPSNLPNTLCLPDPRHADMGWRLYVSHTALDGNTTGSARAYHEQRLALGIPEGDTDFQRDQSFLLECNGEELHAVDFRKGCYVGQELTARMKHRGTARRRILRAIFDGHASPPGTPILDDRREIGAVLGGLGPQSLALIRLDRWREAADRPLTAAGQSVHIHLPAHPLSLPPEEHQT